MSNPRHWRKEGEGPSTLEIQKVVSVPVRREQQIARFALRYIEQCSHEKTGHPASCTCQRVLHDILFEAFNSPGDPVTKKKVSIYRAEKAARRRRDKVIQAVHGERPGLSTFHERSSLFPWFSILRYPEKDNWDSEELLAIIYQFLGYIATASKEVEDRAMESVILRMQSIIEAVMIAHKEGIKL